MTVRDLIGELAGLPKEALDYPCILQEFYGPDTQVVRVLVSKMDKVVILDGEEK